MRTNEKLSIVLDPNGFNEARMCRSGPMVYNKFDIYIGRSLKEYGEFSVLEQDLFEQLIRPGSVVVEVGANIGAHTVDLSRFVGPEGEVHALEPQRLVFQALCANLALNQCTNVFARQEAAGAEIATILVPAMPPGAMTNFGGVSLRGVSYGESVRLVTIDSLDLPMCHFLKVDVEGMEVEVLKGSIETIRNFRPLMYLENDKQEQSAELISQVFELDYFAYWHLPALFRQNNFARVPHDVFNGIVSMNMLCIPREVQLSVADLPRISSPLEWLMPNVDGSHRAPDRRP